MAALGFISRLSVTPGLIIGERADLLTLSRESRNKAGGAALPRERLREPETSNESAGGSGGEGGAAWTLC